MVTVYTKLNCQPCRLTKKKLDTNGIVYAVVSLDEDEQARDYVASLDHASAPVVVVELGDGASWSWSGYRPHHIEKLKEIA